MYFSRIAVLAAVGLLVMLSVSAQADVVNFDDLSGSGVLTSYGGITWTNWTYDSGVSGLPAHSPSTRVHKTTISPASWEFAQPVRFMGAYMNGSFLMNGQQVIYADVSYALYDGVGAMPVYTSPFTTLTSSAMTWVGCEYAGPVKRVVINEPIMRVNPTWAMDDVTYEAVPEPSSLMGLAAGVGGLAALIRRRSA